MAARARRPAHPSNSRARILRATTSSTAKTAYVVVGIVGLAGLAIAIFGPRRFQREILEPARTAVSDRAERLWTEAQPLRTQLGSLIERAGSETGREKLIRSFQSWIGHFRAS